MALLLLLAGCAANAPAPEAKTDQASSDATLAFRVVANGQNAQRNEERTSSVGIFDEATLRNLWPSIAPGEPPAIDFEKEMLIVLFAGSRPTGGWSIEPRAVTVRDTGWIAVDAPVRRPPADAMVTQAFTSPWVALAVSKRELKGISWRPE
jgi:PrcB C-terminal